MWDVPFWLTRRWFDGVRVYSWRGQLLNVPVGTLYGKKCVNKESGKRVTSLTERQEERQRKRGRERNNDEEEKAINKEDCETRTGF